MGGRSEGGGKRVPAKGWECIGSDLNILILEWQEHVYTMFLLAALKWLCSYELPFCFNNWISCVVIYLVYGQLKSIARLSWLMWSYP